MSVNREILRLFRKEYEQDIADYEDGRKPACRRNSAAKKQTVFTLNT